MAPSNPKRPPRPPRPPGATASKKEDVELPFDDDEVAPLQEDDPRPQRVPQFPAGPRRTGARHPGERGNIKDRELATRFDTNEYSDPGHVPAFLYVEKGPGAGQLIPVKQGPLVIGRASACDLRLQHPSISRRHAQIMRQGERFTLRDLGSQNGTFVNRIKISADQEIVVGDELSLGNAVLRLRGSGVLPEKEPPPPTVAPARGARPRLGMSLTRVALVAAAVGSGMAALLTLAFLKFSGPAQRPPSSPPAPSTESASPSTAAPSQEPEAAYVPPPPASEEESAAPPQQEEQEESPRALKPLKAQPEATASGSRSSSPRASSLNAKSFSSRKGSKSSAPSAKAAVRQEDPESPRAAEKAPAPAAAPVDRSEVLSLYEKGDVDGALNLARSGQLEPLAKKLSAVQGSLAAGQEALNAKDNARAIQHLSTALAVDQELSQGWAAHAARIRKQLGKLYTQIGQEQLKAKDKNAARESFEMALKYDPTNTWAKTELQQLSGK